MEKINSKNIILDGEMSVYMILDMGFVYNRKTKMLLKNSINFDGYNHVTLYHNGNRYRKLVHRLVAEAFIPNPENKPEVNHKDGNKTNNDISNLEWVTHSENIQHAYDTGLISIDRMIGENNYLNVYKEYQIHLACILMETGETDRNRISQISGVGIDTLTQIRAKKQWIQVSEAYNIPSTQIPQGEYHGMSKYTEKEIRNVCKLLEDPNKTIVFISNETGIPLDVISKISKGKYWKHISSEYNIPKNRKNGTFGKTKYTEFIISKFQEGKTNNEITPLLMNEFKELEWRQAQQKISDVKNRYIKSSSTIGQLC